MIDHLGELILIPIFWLRINMIKTNRHQQDFINYAERFNIPKIVLTAFPHRLQMKEAPAIDRGLIIKV